jgi:hypothetical protein
MKYQVGQLVKFTEVYPFDFMRGVTRRITLIVGKSIQVEDHNHLFVPDRDSGGGEDWVQPLKPRQMLIQFGKEHV